MKVGNLVDGLVVVDVKRINKMNLIQFTKAVSEYIEMGYKLDVNSSRQVGLVLQMDMYKLESNVGEGVDSVGGSSTEDVVKEPNETKEEVTEDETEYLLSSESNKERLLESVERIKAKVEEGVDESSEETKEDVVELEQTTPPPVKKTRNKKTT